MTATEFARLPSFAVQRWELYNGELHTSEPWTDPGGMITALKATLISAIDDEYMVVAHSRFRVAADTIVQPDLAVVGRYSYCRAQLFRPDETTWVDNVPLLAIVVDAHDSGADFQTRAASAYLARGTNALWIVSPVTRSVSRFTRRGCEVHSHSVTLPRPFPPVEIKIRPLFGP